jgi:F-type H+-transporting ATPase subunit gamma
MLDEIGLETNGNMKGDFLIEPFPETVLETIIPRLIEAELYHAVLESNASQEAARMVAMRSATDAARDMTADLTLAYNQLRQGKITQEIAELSAGMAAVQA